jgi:hypothetical protein
LTDRIQIQQVLLNLMRNVEARGAPRRDLHVITVASYGMAEVSVIDTGTGLALRSPPSFSSLCHHQEAGMGVGLSICRTIVESHGGHIWAEAMPLEEPLSGSPCASLTRKRSPVVASDLVHVVDDDVDVRKSLGFLLGQPTCCTPARIRHSLPGYSDGNLDGCIVTDVHAGHRRRRAQAAQSPRRASVIVMTGHADVALAVQAMKEGTDFTGKPFDDDADQAIRPFADCNQAHAAHSQSAEIRDDCQPCQNGSGRC